jgi:hypothetical protein
MRFALLLLPLLGSIACSGDPPKGPDAANFCAGSAYDPCSDEHSCPLVTDPACQPVGSANLVVCTLACTDGGSACPNDSTGAAGTCVNGFCTPAAAATCTPHPDGM